MEEEEEEIEMEDEEEEMEDEEEEMEDEGEERTAREFLRLGLALRCLFLFHVQEVAVVSLLAVSLLEIDTGQLFEIIRVVLLRGLSEPISLRV